MKPARRINKKNVCPSRFGGLHRVVDDCGRVRAFRGTDDIDARSLGPLAQLLIRRRAEGVRTGDQHSFALFLVICRKLAYGRGLTHAVHADHKDHRRSLLEIVGVLALFHLVSNPQDQFLTAVGAVFDPLLFHLLPEIIQQLFRRLDADISHDHGLFEFLKEFLADFLIPVSIENDIHVVGDVRFCFAKALFEPFKKTHSHLFLCGHPSQSPCAGTRSLSQETSSSSSIRSTLTSAETPFSCIVIPYSRSASCMVPLLCVITMNCVCSVSL